MLRNGNLNEIEKGILDFLLNQDIPQINIIAKQLEHADVDRILDSPYHKIIKFHFNNKKVDTLSLNYKFDTVIKIFHDDDSISCIFLFVKNGYLCEMEMFDSALSVIECATFIQGRVLIE